MLDLYSLLQFLFFKALLAALRAGYLLFGLYVLGKMSFVVLEEEEGEEEDEDGGGHGDDDNDDDDDDGDDGGDGDGGGDEGDDYGLYRRNPPPSDGCPKPLVFYLLTSYVMTFSVPRDILTDVVLARR